MNNNITTYGGDPENFKEYIHGAIDALLSTEKLPEGKSFGGSEKDNTLITLEFLERVPLKAFVNVCNFLNRFDLYDEQLWIVPTADGTIKIVYSE